MAQYEASPDELKQLVESDTLSQSTRNAIQSLLEQNAPVTVLDEAKGTDSTSEGIISQPNTQFNNAVFENVEVAVIDEGASGRVGFTSENGVTTDINTPSGLAIDIKNDADNDVLWHGGQASVTTGDGNDEFRVEGPVKGEIKTGSGNLDLTLDQTAQEQAEISVDAGDGFDLLRLFGDSIKHSFQFNGGKFQMHSAGVTMTGVNVVATDVNMDGKIENGVDHITILASNEKESLIAKLYKVALGRDAIDGEDGWSPDGTGDTLGGLNWWLTQFELQPGNDGSIDFLVRSFLNCDEFHDKYDAMSNREYLLAIGKNIGLSEEEFSGKEQFDTYLRALDAGTMTREDVVYEVVKSDEVVQLLGADGQCYVIDGF